MKLELLLSGDLRRGCDTIEIAMGLQAAGVEVTLDPKEVVGGLPITFLPLLTRDALGKQFDVRLGVDCAPALGKSMVAWSSKDLRQEIRDLDLMILTQPADVAQPLPLLRVLPFGFDPERFKLRKPGSDGRPFRILVDPADENLGMLMQDLAGSDISFDPIREQDYPVADIMLLPVAHTARDARRAIEFTATGGIVMSDQEAGPFPRLLPVDLAHSRPEHISQLGHKLLTLSRCRAQLERVGQSASARVHSEFAWPIVIQKLIRNITQVL